MALRDEIAREAERWQALEIIDAEQRRRILELYPDERGLSLAVLAIFWTGGALVFLGIAFLLGILWEDLGPLRIFVVVGIDGAFFAGGVALARSRPALARTAMALLVIGGLLLPPALGIAYKDLFGSTGHPMPLVLFCTAVYVVLAWRLGSHAFAVLSVLALFFVGEEVVRDEQFSAMFPLVQLGLVRELDDVFPVVFYSLATAVLGVSWYVGRTEHRAHLRSTLWVCALLLGLLPGIAGTFHGQYRELHIALAILASGGGMAASIALRERKAFWVAGAGLAVAFLVMFAEVFDDSLSFTCFAIVLGAGILGAGGWFAMQKHTWLDRLFGEPEPPPEPPVKPVAQEPPT